MSLYQASSLYNEHDMKRKCEISIIMAAYNAERTIQRAIQSVLMQTYQDFELLVVNDCSTDRTAEIVQTFSDERIRLIQNEQNMGVSYTREHGLEEALGEWIAVLDSDDAWTSDKLEKHLDNRIRILFVPESTEGIEAGQMTTMNGEEKVGIVANGAGEHGENIA